MRKPLMLFLSVCLLSSAGTLAQAGPFRCLGLGWGNGYHADCCDDCGQGCGHACGGGLFSKLFCSDPCWRDDACIKTKAVSPGCFGCNDGIPPVQVPVR